MEHSKIDRREFTRLSLLGMLSGVAITIPGCGGGGGGTNNPNPPSNPGSGDKTGFISANHGHAVAITSAQLTAGGNLRLTLRGTQGVSEHSHILDLTAAEVVESSAAVGGGGAPDVVLPSAAVALPPWFARPLRTAPRPVVGHLERGRLLLDLLAVHPDDDAVVVDSVRAVALKPPG